MIFPKIKTQWKQFQNCIANIMIEHTGQGCYFCKAPEGVKLTHIWEDLLSYVFCPSPFDFAPGTL